MISLAEDEFETLDQVMNAISTGKYPSPPARPLYFVSKEEPVKPEVITFLQWILTKGQQYVSEAGYVKLSEDLIRVEIYRLK